MKLAVALVVLLILPIACTTDDVTQVKPIALKKSQFDGEWFERSTLVEKSSHSALAFVGMECQVERVRFQITKDKLLAYRSYDKGAFSPDKNPEHNLVAAFSIVKHFDLNIEKQNDGSMLFIENTSDRPWHKRDYLKVDWTENLNPHLECNGWLQSITTLHLNNNDTHDPKNPYRVRVEDHYMENTVDALVKPDSAMCEKIGETNCHGADYRVKFSFRKIDEKNDYEKRHYPDTEPVRYGMNQQGMCLEGDPDCTHTKELWLYSDAQLDGLCDPLTHNVDECYLPMVKLNAQFGFFRTEVQSYDRKEGFTRRGREQLINRWNLWKKSYADDGKVIPLEKRVPRKIVYYLNAGFPSELLPSIKKVEREWNTAFVNVVAKVKNQNDIDSAASMDHREIEKSFGKIFEIRVNDCNVAHIKDFVAKHDIPHILKEYGLSVIDEKNIEQACAVLEWASDFYHLDVKFRWQQTGDLRFSFINVVTKPEGESLLGYGPPGIDPKTGEIINGNANVYLASITKYAASGAQFLGYLENLPSDVAVSLKHTMSNDVDLHAFSAYVEGVAAKMTPGTFKKTREQNFQIANFAEAKNLNIFESFRGWPALDLARSSADEEIDRIIALIGGQTHDFIHQQKKHQFFSERNACFSANAQELPYLRLTHELKNMSFLERVRIIKARIFENTLMHELGHTFGLRHNFKGAYDALNYSPSFWGVDTFDFRMRRGLSEEELRSSSIMDYHMRFNSDFSGLGLYDYAALLSGYGEKVEIFDTTQEDFVPKSFMNVLHLMNYKDFPYLFSGNDAEQKIARHYHHMKDRFLRGDASAHMEIPSLGLPSKPDNFYKRRYVDYHLLKRNMFDTIFKGTTHFVQVPYGFCSDSQIGHGDIACQPFVFGSSASEIVDNAINDYELAHVIESQGGHVLPKEVPAYLSYVYRRVYAPILRTYQSMYVTSTSTAKIFPAVHDLTVGAKRGLDFIGAVLQAVEPGEYCKNSIGNYFRKTDEGVCVDSVIINDVVGKKYHSAFGDDLTGPAGSIGFVYDKVLALLALIDDHASVNHEFSKWEHHDYSIGFYRIFTPQLAEIFTNIYTDQWQNLAPAVEKGQDQQPRIIYRDLFSPDGDRSLKNLGLIKPSSSSVLRDYAILFSIAGLSSHFDHKLDFAKRARINVLNNNSASSANDIIFRDPNTGIGYQATLHDEREEASPGYLLLKDVSSYTAPGRRGGGVGPWYAAKMVLEKALTKRNAEDEIMRARKEFADKNRVLNEKVRIIEQVARLSRKFAD